MRGDRILAAIWWHDSDEDWKFAPAEQPKAPGAPATPDHSVGLRLAYFAVAVLVGITGGLGNALVLDNVAELQGALGAYIYEIAWLPVAYVMTNVVINLLFIRFRERFGLRLFTGGFVALYALVTLGHIFVHTFRMAVMVRAASGMAGAALNTLAIFYMIQAAPAKWRPHAIVIGLGVPQLATPLARLFPTEPLAFDQWRTLYTFEFGLALITFAAVVLLRLPHGNRAQPFKPFDFLSFSLIAGGLALFAAVIGEGRYLWWWDTPWLGWVLCASIASLVAAIVLEYHRRRPLLAIRWLSSADLVRFLLVGILVRVVQSEQPSGAVGLLNSLGFNNDQFHSLFWIAAAATLGGTLASASLLSVRRLTQQIIVALALAAVGAALDSNATNLTRPQQLYFSQALVAFSTTFCLGPAFLFGLFKALRKGEVEFISFIALFGIAINLGSLIGSSLLGTFQVIREKTHSNVLVQHIVLTDPQVATRLQQSGLAYGSVTIDPALRGAEGASLLSQQVTREANVLAYNDMFQGVAILAAAAALYLAGVVILRGWRARQTQVARQ
jgi:MFS family permease